VISITQQNDELLYGREDEVRAIVENCLAGRLTVITSEPGLGITSLLELGVSPALKEAGFTVIPFKHWTDRRIALRVEDAVAQARTPLAFVLDQFEDYLRFHVNTDISDTFDAELSRAIAGHQATFVIGMQEQALEAFERFHPYIPSLLRFHRRLPGLTRELARELSGGKVDLDAPMLACANGQIHPFYLKAAIRGAGRPVLESLDARIAELGSHHVELLFRWCPILISPEERRVAVTAKSLTDHAPPVVEAGILRRVGSRYELARECLTPILHDWWKRREAVVAARRRASFRIVSISVATGSIVLMFGVWILWRYIL
jgi:hypothetical protein